MTANLKYGVSLYSYTGEFGTTLTFEDCVADVADLGATGLEILGEAHVRNYPNPSSAWLDAWFALLERHQLEPTCYGSWIDTRRGSSPMTVDEAVEQLETDIRLAGRLGFRFVRPKLGVVTSDLEPDPIWAPATERVLDLAVEQGIVICPEIHWPSVIRSKVVDDYLAFAERVGTDNFGLLMDTGVFQKSMHHRQGGVASRLGTGSARPPITPVVPVADLETVIDHVVYFQAKFYEIGDDLDDAYIPWREILDVLDAHNWSGYLSSEYEGDYGVGRASDQVRRQHALLRILGFAVTASDVRLEAAGHEFTVRAYPAAASSPDDGDSASTGGLLVWAHGGAFLGGSLDMPEADEVGRRMAAAGVPVLSVGYTLAPADLLLEMPDSERGEHIPSRDQVLAEIAASGPRARFPVASLQLVAAYDWAVEHAADFGASPDRIAIGGASAGGNLATGAALRIRDRGGRPPVALLLCYPALHPVLPPPLPGAPVNDQDASGRPHSELSLNYVGDPAGLKDPYAFPGGHPAGGLPVTVIVTAEHDELRVSAEVYAAEIAIAGGDVTLRQEAGASHGFLNVVGDPAAERTLGRFVAALTEPQP